MHVPCPLSQSVGRSPFFLLLRARAMPRMQCIIPLCKSGTRAARARARALLPSFGLRSSVSAQRACFTSSLIGSERQFSWEAHPLIPARSLARSLHSIARSLARLCRLSQSGTRLFCFDDARL